MSRKNHNHTGLKAVLILQILLFIAATALMIKLSLDLPGKTAGNRPAAETVTLPAAPATQPPETEPPSSVRAFSR